MTTQPQVQSQSDDVRVLNHRISGEVVVGYAVLGCLTAGTIGIFKATLMDGIGAAFCLLA